MAARKKSSRVRRPGPGELWTGGAVATVVASAAAAALVAFDVAPYVQPLVWLAAWTGHSAALALLVHAVMGIAVLPAIFVRAAPRMPAGGAMMRGLWFSAALVWLWLFVGLPLLGVGLLGLVLGWQVPLAVVFLQGLYGLTLALMQR